MLTNAGANRRAFIMEHEYFLSIVAAGCIVIMFYAYKTLWARYHQSQATDLPLGPPAPPFKRTISGVAELEAEGDELNEKMLEWQKMYQHATEAAVEAEKPEHVSKIEYSEEVEHFADILMPGDRKMSYGEYLERKLDARDTLKPVRQFKGFREPSVPTKVGRFY
jgi:hypothetical protein